MKTAATLLLTAFCLSASLPAQDSSPSLGDRLKRAVDRTKDALAGVADKVQSKSRTWYNNAKSHLTMSQYDYYDRAGSAIARMDAEVAVLQELASGPGEREYFKTRILALQQHLKFAHEEFDKLKTSETEEMFRARQKGFEHTLGALEAAVGQAQEEAGL
jgi:hypothetical protein